MTQIVSIDSYYRLHPKQRKGSGAYRNYVRGIKQQRAIQNDPLRLYTDAQLQSRAASSVDAAIAPVIAQLTKTYRDRAAQAGAGIQALTGDYVHAAGQYAPAVAGAYREATSGQANVDAALASLLQGGGTALAGELGAKLGAGSEAAVAAPGIAGGAAGAQYATGSADLAKLIAQAASAQDYGAKLPGIAAATGVQAVQQSNRSLDQQLQSVIDGITQQVPGQVASLYQNLKSSNTQTALARQSGLLDTSKYTQTEADKAAALAERQRHNRQSEANARANRKSKNAPLPNSALSKVYGYVVDQFGHPILGANGQKQPVKTTPQQQNGPAAKRTKAFYSTRNQAFNKAQSLYNQGSSSGPAGKGHLAGGGASKRPTYDTAFNTLYSQYGTALLNQWGFTDTAVRQMLRNALIAAGYADPAVTRRKRG